MKMSTLITSLILMATIAACHLSWAGAAADYASKKWTGVKFDDSKSAEEIAAMSNGLAQDAVYDAKTNTVYISKDALDVQETANADRQEVIDYYKKNGKDDDGVTSEMLNDYFKNNGNTNVTIDDYKKEKADAEQRKQEAEDKLAQRQNAKNQLEKEIKAAENKIKEEQARVAAIQKEIDDIKADKELTDAEKKDRIKGKENELADANNNIKAQKDVIAKNKNQIAGIDKEIAGIRTEIEEIKEDLAEINEDIENLKMEATENEYAYKRLDNIIERELARKEVLESQGNGQVAQNDGGDGADAEHSEIEEHDDDGNDGDEVNIGDQLPPPSIQKTGGPAPVKNITIIPLKPIEPALSTSGKVKSPGWKMDGRGNLGNFYDPAASQSGNFSKIK